MARLLLAMLLLPMAAAAADDTRISFLEQEVRNLQRQVQSLSMQMNDLQRRPDRPRARRRRRDGTASPSRSDTWIDRRQVATTCIAA